jgi:hypothetical protein
LYGRACAEFHGAITAGGRTVPVLSRNGNYYEVKAPLDKGEVILSRLEAVVAHLKKEAPDLFLSSFNQTFDNQKHEVLNYLFDPIVDGKWYMETTDGKFTLFRGSGRNESYHRRYVNL